MEHRRTLPILAFGIGILVTTLLIISLTGLTQSLTLAADEFTVCPDGTCDYTTIQAAVDAAGDGDRIKVAEGVYAGVSVRPRDDIIHTGVVTQVVYIDKSVNIQGGYTTDFAEPPDPAAHPTIINPQGQGRGVYITGYISPTIAGLQITEGDARNQGGLFTNLDFDSGGGVFVISATATIRDCLIFSNTVDAPGFESGQGGGIYLVNDHSIIQDNDIRLNTTSAYNGQGGGLFLNQSSARIEDNRIEDNSLGTLVDGGGLYAYEGNPTVISNTITGNQVARSGGGLVFYGTATITGNTIEGNTAGVDGGGMYGYGNLTVTHNIFYSNTAASGGGLNLQAGTYEVGGNTILTNTAVGGSFNQGGGGMYFEDSGGTVSDNEIAGNTANTHGGGVFVYDSSGVTLNRNLVTGNTALLGGGMFVFYTDGLLDANTFRENLAHDGGGLYLNWTDMSLTNNLIADNEAVEEGAGICIQRGAPEILHSTIANNTGWSGVYVRDYSSMYASPVFANTILSGHDVGIHVAAGNTADLDATLLENTANFSGPGVITHTNDLFGDPLYFDPLAGDYHIRGNSPARDSGVNVFVTTDIDGQGRPQGGAVDIGADEFHPLPGLSVVKFAEPTQAQAGMPLTYTIILSNTGNMSLHATITDTLPAQVTPGGTLVWSPPPIGVTETWTKTIAVTVEAGYIGDLTNQVMVTTIEGPVGTAVNTISTAAEWLYLPAILRQP